MKIMKMYNDKICIYHISSSSSSLSSWGYSPISFRIAGPLCRLLAVLPPPLVAIIARIATCLRSQLPRRKCLTKAPCLRARKPRRVTRHLGTISLRRTRSHRIRRRSRRGSRLRHRLLESDPQRLREVDTAKTPAGMMSCNATSAKERLWTAPAHGPNTARRCIASRESTTKKDGGHGTGAGIGQIRTSPMSISAGRHGNAASKGRVRLWLAVVVPLRRPARSNSQDPVVVAAARRGATQGRIEVMKGDAVAGGPRLLGRRKGIPDRGARRMSRWLHLQRDVAAEGVRNLRILAAADRRDVRRVIATALADHMRRGATGEASGALRQPWYRGPRSGKRSEPGSILLASRGRKSWKQSDGRLTGQSLKPYRLRPQMQRPQRPNRVRPQRSPKCPAVSNAQRREPVRQRLPLLGAKTTTTMKRKKTQAPRPLRKTRSLHCVQSLQPQSGRLSRLRRKRRSARRVQQRPPWLQRSAFRWRRPCWPRPCERACGDFETLPFGEKRIQGWAGRVKSRFFITFNASFAKNVCVWYRIQQTGLCLWIAAQQTRMWLATEAANAHVFGERENIRVSVWDGNVRQTRMCGKCVCFMFFFVFGIPRTGHPTRMCLVTGQQTRCIWLVFGLPNAANAYVFVNA